jgi:hypothetical protein
MGEGHVGGGGWLAARRPWGTAGLGGSTRARTGGARRGSGHGLPTSGTCVATGRREGEEEEGRTLHAARVGEWR